MLSTSELAADIIANRGYVLTCRAESWLGGDLLHDDVPIDTGAEEVDRSLRVPERITLTVPKREGGYSWAPDTDNHPLAANGQQLRIQLGIGIKGGQTEWLQRGWFLITDTEPGEDSVSVEACGLLTYVDEGRLVSPYQPSANLTDTVRGLVEPALTVVFDAGLTDRAVPTGVNFDEDRLGALLELFDAWPAEASVTADGYLYVTTATDAAADSFALTDGVGGTIVRGHGRSTREGGWNAAVVRGTDSAGAQVQGVAYAPSTGPKGYGSLFNPLPVPYFLSTPLVTSTSQANAAAATVLARLQRESSHRTYEVEAVPDPRLQVGDAGTLTLDTVTNLPCVIEWLSMPYTANAGAMRLRVRSLA